MNLIGLITCVCACLSPPDSLIIDTTLATKDFLIIVDYLDQPTFEQRTIPLRQYSVYQKKALVYIEKYASLAIAERDKFGIPASITMAQALIESGFGESRLAKHHNNHFGMKCKSHHRKAKRKCVIFADDTKRDQFVHFESVWESYRDHSLRLKTERYQALYQIPVTDYENWALGLGKMGYASDKNYGEKLIKIIEMYDLFELDF